MREEFPSAPEFSSFNLINLIANALKIEALDRPLLAFDRRARFSSFPSFNPALRAHDGNRTDKFYHKMII
jgi:hypothetical protein